MATDQQFAERSTQFVLLFKTNKLFRAIAYNSPDFELFLAINLNLLKRSMSLPI